MVLCFLILVRRQREVQVRWTVSATRAVRWMYGYSSVYLRIEEQSSNHQKQHLCIKNLEIPSLQVEIDLQNKLLARLSDTRLLLLFCRGAFDPKVDEFIAQLSGVSGVCLRICSGASDTYIFVLYPSGSKLIPSGLQFFASRRPIERPVTKSLPKVGRKERNKPVAAETDASRATWSPLSSRT